jgi:hypothetical protein
VPFVPPGCADLLWPLLTSLCLNSPGASLLVVVATELEDSGMIPLKVVSCDGGQYDK